METAVGLITMRYFKKHWYDNDKKAEKTLKTYNHHIQKMLCSDHDILLHIYARKLIFHDAVIHMIKLKKDILKIKFLLGDNELGYFKCSIEFKCLATNAADFNILPIEILYDETFDTTRDYRTNFLLLNNKELFVEFLKINKIILKHYN